MRGSGTKPRVGRNVADGSAAGARQTGERLGPLAPADLTAAQLAASAAVVASRGKMGGPFVALLRSPEFLIRLQHLGAYLRFESVLPPHLSELVILLVARNWSQNYEWSVHAPIARDVGLGAHIVEAIAAGARPFEMPADVALVHDFCIELFLHRGVSDRLYEDAVTHFGEQGVVDLTGIAGYYTTLAMIMNVARSAPAADATDLLPPLP